MPDDPMDMVYSFVERAYVRLQAGDVLIRCLEEGATTPIQEMVEGLVLAGPQSLSALREILAETGQRKSQIQDDMHQIFVDLEKSLKSYGVPLVKTKDPLAVSLLTPLAFLVQLRELGITENDTQVACLQLLKDSRELIDNLISHFKLMEEIEAYLQDWIWGLAYQLTHADSSHLI